MLRTTIADLMLAKGRRGLVKKIITVTRAGRTFQTTKWVLPDKEERKPKEAPAKPLLFEDELQTIRDMLERGFNPELVANKIERERDQMDEKPLPRKSIMNAIGKVEAQLSKEGVGRSWHTVVAETWERAKKAKEKVAPKKAVVKEEIKDPTQKEGLEGATTKVENVQMRLSKMFARVHQLQTMLAMLKQRAESAKRLPPTPKKDKALPTKPRGERGPGTGVRKARSLITDIQAELHTLEADLKSLGLQDLAAQFPQLAKQVAATTKAIEAVKTNLRNAEDALKGLEKPKEDVKEATEPKESVKEVAEQKRTAADLRVVAKQKFAESAFKDAFDKQSQDPTTDDYTNVVHGLSAALGKFGYKIDPKVLDTTYGHIVSSVGEKAQTAKEAAVAALTRMVPISFLPRGQSATEKLERMGDDIELVTALSKLAGETEEKRQGRIDAYEKAGEKLVPRAKFESAAQAQKVRSELEKLKEERRKAREKQYGAQSEVRAIRGQKGAMEILEAQAKAPMAKPTKPVETPEQEQQRETKEAKEQLKSDIDWMNTLPIKDQRDVIEKNERQLSDKARAAYDEARKSGKPVDKELPYKQRLAAERALEMQKQFTKNWEKSPAGKEAKEIRERRKALAEKLAKERAAKPKAEEKPKVQAIEAPKEGSSRAQKHIQAALNNLEVKKVLAGMSEPTANIVRANLRGIADTIDHGSIRKETGVYLNKVIKDNPGFDVASGRKATMLINKLANEAAGKDVPKIEPKKREFGDNVKDHPNYEDAQKHAKGKGLSLKPWSPDPKNADAVKRIYIKENELDVGYVEQRKAGTPWKFVAATKRSTRDLQKRRDSLGEPVADAMNKGFVEKPKEAAKSPSVTPEQQLEAAYGRFKEAELKYKAKAMFGTPEEKVATKKAMDKAKDEYIALRSRPKKEATKPKAEEVTKESIKELGAKTKAEEKPKKATLYSDTVHGLTVRTTGESLLVKDAESVVKQFDAPKIGSVSAKHLATAAVAHKDMHDKYVSKFTPADKAVFSAGLNVLAASLDAPFDRKNAAANEDKAYAMTEAAMKANPTANINFVEEALQKMKDVTGMYHPVQNAPGMDSARKVLGEHFKASPWHSSDGGVKRVYLKEGGSDSGYIEQRGTDGAWKFVAGRKPPSGTAEASVKSAVETLNAGHKEVLSRVGKGAEPAVEKKKEAQKPSSDSRMKDYPTYKDAQDRAKGSGLTLTPWTPSDRNSDVIKRVYIKEGDREIGYAERRKSGESWQFISSSQGGTSRKARDHKEGLGQPIADAMNGKQPKLDIEKKKEAPKAKVAESPKDELAQAKDRYDKAVKKYNMEMKFGYGKTKADAKKAMEEAKAQYEDVKSQPTKK